MDTFGPLRAVAPLLVVTVLAAVASTAFAVPALAAGTRPSQGPDPDAVDWVWPLSPEPSVERGFERPRSEYGAGHRGVDLAGTPGSQVVSVADGVVAFVGDVAGTPVVTVEHAQDVSTYQPVSSRLEVGERVVAGEPLGSLVRTGSHCLPRACLHLGRKVGGEYADPLALLEARGSHIRLMTPYGEPPTPPAPPRAVRGGDGALATPVAGPVTSPYGMRTHPLTGEHKLHDGTDFGAACGTPVRAAADGMVDERYFNAGYGNRVVIDHGSTSDEALTTTYNHLTRGVVAVGERVRRGQVVGYVGSTGYSTGCHLHFMVLRGGDPVDPMGWL